MAEVYSLFDYDLGRLTEAEQGAFSQTGVAVPENWLGEDVDPVVVFSLPHGRSLAVVLLPYVPRGVYELPEKVAGEARRRIRRARERADMVVALSPWGYTMELDFAGSSKIIPDILLGAGPGSGINGQFLRDDRLLWVRPYPLGKTANVISILEWPQDGPQNGTEKGLDLRWVNGQNVRLKVESYSEKFQERPDVLDILEPVQTP